MFNTLSTPFSLMDSVDIIHLKIGRAPLPTVYGWNGTHCLDAQAKGGPMIYTTNPNSILYESLDPGSVRITPP